MSFLYPPTVIRVVSVQPECRPNNNVVGLTLDFTEEFAKKKRTVLNGVSHPNLTYQVRKRL